MPNIGLRGSLRRHALALILFPLLAFVWVGDTLFMGVDLSAFDVIFRLPHWKAEYEYRGVQQIILSDSPQAHYPERALKWGAARHGERVDFNPYIFTGISELSQGAGAFITSPFQLFMDVSEAIDWSSWFRLALAGLFMYAFLIALGIRSQAAILGGVIWAFNFHQLAWLEFPQHLATQLWIPLLFGFNYLILRRGVTWETFFGILIVNTFFFTSDYIQIVLYTYVAIGLFNTIYLLADNRLTVQERARHWVMVHSVFILSALALAPEVVVEVQLLGEGLRGQQQWRAHLPDLNWSLGLVFNTFKNALPDIADYKRLFSPNFFGGLWGTKYVGSEHVGNVIASSIYSSIVVFLAAPFSLLWLRSPVRRPFLLASFGVLAFAFGMAHKDPIFINVFGVIPLGGFGGYDRFITIVIFLLSVISAIGLNTLMALRPNNAIKLFYAVLVVVGASPLFIHVFDASITWEKMRYPVFLLTGIGVSVGAFVYLRKWREIPLLLVLVAVVDLLIVTYPFNPRMEDQRNFPLTPTLKLLIEDGSHFRVAEVSRTQLYPPNILQYYGIASIGGYSTVAPDRYLKFVDKTIDDHHVTDNGQLFFFDVNHEVFRLLNVKYLLSPEDIDDDRLELVREAPGYQVYRLRDHLPRAYCASTLLNFETDTEVLKAFRQIALRFDRPVALVGTAEDPVPLTPDCRVTNIDARLNGVAFEVSSEADTYVFVAYNYYPGWKARSDNEPIPVIKANYNFIALPIKPGTHHIELVYRDGMNVVFSIVMIILGAVVVAWSLTSGRKTLTTRLLGLAGLVLVSWSLLEIPGVGNSVVPEGPDSRFTLSGTQVP